MIVNREISCARRRAGAAVGSCILWGCVHAAARRISGGGHSAACGGGAALVRRCGTRRGQRASSGARHDALCGRRAGLAAPAGWRPRALVAGRAARCGRARPGRAGGGICGDLSATWLPCCEWASSSSSTCVSTHTVVRLQDYLQYQSWDTLQALTSYLRGILATCAAASPLVSRAGPNSPVSRVCGAQAHSARYRRCWGRLRICDCGHHVMGRSRWRCGARLLARVCLCVCVCVCVCLCVMMSPGYGAAAMVASLLFATWGSARFDRNCKVRAFVLAWRAAEPAAVRLCQFWERSRGASSQTSLMMLA